MHCPKRGSLTLRAIVCSLALGVSACPSTAQTTKISRPVADPLKCGCNCKCVANAMFNSKRHALAWAKASLVRLVPANTTIFKGKGPPSAVALLFAKRLSGPSVDKVSSLAGRAAD